MSCCVNFCKNRSDRRGAATGTLHPLHFYRFPSDPTQRALWIKAARRWDLLKTNPGPNRRVCSAHFITGKFSQDPRHPDYVPSIFSFNKKREYTRITERVQRFNRLGKRCEVPGYPFHPLPNPTEHLQGAERRTHSKKTTQNPTKPQTVPSEETEQLQGTGHVQGAVINQGHVLFPDRVLPPGTILVDSSGNILNVQGTTLPLGTSILQGAAQPQGVGGQSYLKKTPQNLTKPQSVPSVGAEQLQGPRVLLDSNRRIVNVQRTVLPPGTRVLQGARDGHLHTVGNGFLLNNGRLQGPVLYQGAVQLQGAECHSSSRKTPQNPTKAQSVPSVGAGQLLGAGLNEALAALGAESNVAQMMILLIYNPPKPVPLEVVEADHTYSQSATSAPDPSDSSKDEAKAPLKDTPGIAPKAATPKPKDSTEKNRNATETKPSNSERPSEKKLVALNCPVCENQYLTIDSYLTHMAKHAVERYRCKVCEKLTKGKAELAGHMRIHTGEKPFSCSFCDKCFHLKKTMTTHLKVHIGPQCSICGRKFRSVKLLEVHRLKHREQLKGTEEEQLKGVEEGCTVEIKNMVQPQGGEMSCQLKLRFPCVVCGKAFPKQRRLEEHMTLHTGERPHQCTVCHKRYRTRTTLAVHTKRHTAEKPFSCSVCTKSFWKRDALNAHMEALHTGKTFECNECGRKFASKSKLQFHSKRHAKDRPYRCSVCLQLFESMETAEEHLEFHKKEAEASERSSKRSDMAIVYLGAQYLCTECGKVFYAKQNLEKHMRVHTQDRPFSCSQCGLKFKDKVSLSTHMMLHTDERPFSCSVCPKTFRVKVTLDKHMLMHSGVKQFSCDVCAARFSKKSSLKTHSFVHSKEQPFSCLSCPKKYKSLQQRNNHMRAAHGAGDHPCPTCHKVFMTDAGLHRHMGRAMHVGGGAVTGGVAEGGTVAEGGASAEGGARAEGKTLGGARAEGGAEDLETQRAAEAILKLTVERLQ